jgi:outer membrane protein insertion porin family
LNVLAANVSKRYQNIIPLAALLLFFASCSVVRDYPARPFVYQTDIVVQGDLTTTDRKDLESRLNEQLHDSIAVRSVQKLIGFDKGPKLFYSVIKNPPAYDSIHADQSLGFMSALLHSQGYYRDSIRYAATIKTSGDEQRTFVTFYVMPGKLFRIDSVRFNLNDSLLRDSLPVHARSMDTLQLITEASLKESLIKKGDPFAKPQISAEFDRLTNVYRNNGYLRFTREGLLAVWDTVGVALLRPTFDPAEQAALFEALQRRRENPVADIEVRLRPTSDTTQLVRYRVGNVTVYPDVTADTVPGSATRRRYRDYQIVSYSNMFKPKVVAENIYLRRGDLYDQRLHQKTLSRFNAVGSWRLVSVEPVTRPNTDTVDFIIRLTPTTKYLFDVNIEGSHNLGGIYTGSNLIGLNFTLANRNFARGANQSITSVGFATEINSESLLKTIQVSAGQTIFFPRMIPKWLPVRRSLRENARTSLAVNARYVNRVEYLDLRSVNVSWGYDFNWKKNLLLVRIPNFEYNELKQGPELETLVQQNQSYRYIFNDGLVSSDFIPVVSYTLTGGRKGVANLLRSNFETSGLLSGFIKSDFLDSNLNRYIKVDASFSQNRKIGLNNAFAWRAFFGVGYSIPYTNFGGQVDKGRQFMPFYKSYYAGGANSMRGWALRRLGPGSTIKSFAKDIAPERFGDMQIEGNAEYRFQIANIRGVTLNSALFTDIGNVWTLRKNEDFPGGEFRFNKLWHDLAVDVGTGVRVDFGFIKIRLDYAFKAKDPSPDLLEAQNKWFYKFDALKGTFQVGVDYPF